MKIIFFGAPEFAEIILGSLIKNRDFNVVCVVTNPDKPAGRKRNLTYSPVKRLSAEKNIKILQPAKLKDSDFIKQIKELNAEIFVVASYGKIIPKEILEIPKFGCINIHGSLLPKYRGASPIQSALLNGDKKSGITIMLMDEGMDTGPILDQETISIKESDNFPSLSEKMAKLGAKMLDKILPEWTSGNREPAKQDDSKATYTRLLKSEDYEINWGKSAEKIHNQARAMYPNAYGIADIKNREIRIKILETRICERKNIKEIGKLENWKRGSLFIFNKKLFVFCGSDDLLEIVMLQPSGKNVMASKDFINGHKEIPNISIF